MNSRLFLRLVVTAWVIWAGAGLLQAQQTTDTILYNGKIVTVDDHSFSSSLGTIAQAMHVRDGKILHLGNNAEIRAMAGPNSRVIDLNGRTVIPGFVLTHEHPWDWGSVNPYVLKKVLTDDIVVARFLENGSPQENAKAFPGVLSEAVSKARPGQWIYIVETSGKRFESQSMSNGGVGRALLDDSVRVPDEMQITAEQIEAAAPDNPVYAGGWLVQSGIKGGEGINQRAIDEANQAMPDPRMNSLVPVEDESIRSNSPARSTRRWMFGDVIMKDHYPQLVEVMKAELEWWAGYGMTSFASNAYTPSNLRVYRDLDSKRQMPVRYMWTWNWNPEYLYSDPFFLTDLATRTGEGSDYLWYGGAIISVGAGCTTAEPIESSKAYQYRLEQAQAQGQGLQRFLNCNYDPGSQNAEFLEKYVQAGGRFVNLHAPGDRDIDNIMEIIERASKEAGMTEEEIRAKRHGLDHGTIWPRPDQLPVMKRLGILADGDTYEIVTASPTVLDLYGERAVGWVVPKKSLMQAEIYNSFEVDRPIATTETETIFSAGMAPMITRRAWDGNVYAQNEAVDRESALKIATYMGAYYLLRENIMGSLEPGKWADFLVLDRDYLTIPEDDIKNIRVLMTTVGGKVVHLTPSLAREFGMQSAGAQVEFGGPAAQW